MAYGSGGLARGTRPARRPMNTQKAPERRAGVRQIGSDTSTRHNVARPVAGGTRRPAARPAAGPAMRAAQRSARPARPAAGPAMRAAQRSARPARPAAGPAMRAAQRSAQRQAQPRRQRRRMGR